MKIVQLAYGTIISGGSGWAKERAPHWTKISSFSCRFWKNNSQIVAWGVLQGLAPPSGKSWVHNSLSWVFSANTVVDRKELFSIKLGIHFSCGRLQSLIITAHFRHGRNLLAWILCLTVVICKNVLVFLFHNKKVLLRERKRHTDRRLSSTPSVNRSGVPPPPSGYPPQSGYPPCRGTPHPGLLGGYPHQGTPPSGYPPSEYPPIQVWQGGTPQSDGGIPGVLPRWGTPPLSGHPPPPGWTWLGYLAPLSVDRQTGGWMDGQTRVKT